MAEAWFCPACQKHHAPHVETCPGGVGTSPYRYVQPVRAPAPIGGCACPVGHICKSTGCPRGTFLSGSTFTKYPPGTYTITNPIFTPEGTEH